MSDDAPEGAPGAGQTIGDRIAWLRLQRRKTRTALGAEVGLGEAAVRQIETGGSKQPTFQNGVRIARALGVSPDYLAFGVDSAPEREEIGRLKDALNHERSEKERHEAHVMELIEEKWLSESRLGAFERILKSKGIDIDDEVELSLTEQGVLREKVDHTAGTLADNARALTGAELTTRLSISHPGHPEIVAELARILERCTVTDQQIFLLRDEGLSSAEIVAELGIPGPQVTRQYRSVLRRIQRRVLEFAHLAKVSAR